MWTSFFVFQFCRRCSRAFCNFLVAILLRLHDRVRWGGGAARPPKFLRRWKLKNVWLGKWTRVRGVKLFSCIDSNKSMSCQVNKVDHNILNVWSNKVKSWSRIQYTMWHDESHGCCVSQQLLVIEFNLFKVWWCELCFFKKCNISFIMLSGWANSQRSNLRLQCLHFL